MGSPWKYNSGWKTEDLVIKGSTLYLGEENTEGSWRIIQVGSNLSIERLESGSWVEKASFTP